MTLTIDRCAVCGIEGVQADTTAGEIIGESGRVESTVPDGMAVLLVGGIGIGMLMCDDCARDMDAG